MACVGPVLKDDLVLQFVVFLHLLQNGIEHRLVVLDRLEVLDIERGHFFATGDTADEGVAGLDVLPSLDAGIGQLV